MMNETFLRFEKVKARADIGSRAAHNLRQSATSAPFADPDRRMSNRVINGPLTAAEVANEFDTVLNGAPRYRSDAVLAIEALMTASPKFFDEQRPNYAIEVSAWIRGSCQWLADTFTSGNIISLVLHMDETRPHLHA